MSTLNLSRNFPVNHNSEAAASAKQTKHKINRSRAEMLIWLPWNANTVEGWEPHSQHNVRNGPTCIQDDIWSGSHKWAARPHSQHSCHHKLFRRKEAGRTHTAVRDGSGIQQYLAVAMLIKYCATVDDDDATRRVREEARKADRGKGGRREPISPELNSSLPEGGSLGLKGPGREQSGEPLSLEESRALSQVTVTAAGDRGHSSLAEPLANPQVCQRLWGSHSLKQPLGLPPRLPLRPPGPCRVGAFPPGLQDTRLRVLLHRLSPDSPDCSLDSFLLTLVFLSYSEAWWVSSSFHSPPSKWPPLTSCQLCCSSWHMLYSSALCASKPRSAAWVWHAEGMNDHLTPSAGLRDVLLTLNDFFISLNLFITLYLWLNLELWCYWENFSSLLN